MGRTKAQKKGDNLEEAISFIEDVLHSENPEPFKEIRITTKAKFNSGMHEVDVLVTKILPTEEKIAYIFECKNWDRKKVNKNEVTLLADKVADYKTQMAKYGIIDVKGVMVGKSFSRHAKTKSKQYMIQMVVAKDILKPVQNAPSIQVTSKGDILYGTYAFNSSNPSAEVFVQDNPIAVTTTGQSFNLNEFSFNSFKAEFDGVELEFIQWIEKNANETRNYKKRLQLNKEINPPVHIGGILADRLRVDVFLEVWFGAGEFVYGFDVPGKKKIMKQVLEIKEDSKIPVTYLSEPGLPW